LYNFAPKPRGVPDLRSAARSITVLEADVNWNNIKFGNFPIQISKLSAETAKSIKNPNTSDRAMIESFEGVKIEDSANLNKDSWQVAANPEKGNPSSVPAGGAFNKGYASALTLSNEDVRITDINPSAPVESGDRIQALKLDYNFGTNGPSEAASVVQTLSKSGIDFFTHRRQFLELWVLGDNSNAEMRFRLGRTSEFSDSDTSGSLKTEDVDKNGSLSPGEDVGWQFIDPNGSTTTIGSGNGRLDTQDLDGNGRLDSDDASGNYYSESALTINFSGWKVFQLPLNIPTTAQAEWSSIKDLRVTVYNPTNAPKSGTIRLGRISTVGTRFTQATVEPSSGAVTATVFAENNQDNPGYPSLLTNPAYRELYDIQEDNPKKREQALAIQYQRVGNTVSVSTVTTKETFSTPLDFSEHETLKFFLVGDNSGNQFFFRIGTPGNYMEYKTPLSFSGPRLIELDILDKNRDGGLDKNEPKAFGKWEDKPVGTPSLRNIKEITMGVLVAAGAPDAQSSKIYVNEIHLSGSVTLIGEAHRASADFSWPGWASWGANFRTKNKNYQTLTTASSGIDEFSGSAYMNVNRLKFLPLNSNLSLSETKTPQIQTVNDPNKLVSVLREGKSTTRSQNLSGNFLMTNLPWIPNVVKSKFLNFD
ncbi:MAG: hypothetical protein HYY63_01325, partial [Elusimicrobia bacterium]|nr:hypothetical protein [Elusimicrobiota bacterium]